MARERRKPPDLQGEGNYDAARRYRRGVEEFVGSHDTEALARQAQPKSPEEARALESAEASGRSRARVRKRNADTTTAAQPVQKKGRTVA